MTDSAGFDFDMNAFCAAVLREYEDVIETIIQRPIRFSPIAEQGPGVGARSLDGGLPSERA